MAAVGACHFNGFCRCHRVVHVRRDVADGHRVGFGFCVWCGRDRAASGHRSPAVPVVERFVSVCAAARDDGRAIVVGSIASGPLPDPIRLCQCSH